MITRRCRHVQISHPEMFEEKTMKNVPNVAIDFLIQSNTAQIDPMVCSSVNHLDFQYSVATINCIPIFAGVAHHRCICAGLFQHFYAFLVTCHTNTFCRTPFPFTLICSSRAFFGLGTGTPRGCQVSDSSYIVKLVMCCHKVLIMLTCCVLNFLAFKLETLTDF